MADTPSGETVTPGDSQTTVQTTAPAQGNAVDQAEVERLRKEAEQARMRANQLEKEAEARKKADEEAEAKRLEEQNQWKEIAEQEKAKRLELETAQEQAQRKAELEAAKAAIFKDFNQDVVELANDAGLDLADTSEEAQDKLRATLDRLQAKISSETKVTPNNPNTPPVDDRAKLLEQMRYGDREARAKVISSIPAVEEMRRQAGLS